MNANTTKLIPTLIAILTLSALCGCSEDDDFGPALRLSIQRFQSCGDIDDYLNDIRERYRRAQGGDDRDETALQTGGMSPMSADSGALNLHESGVDEADHVRVNDSQIYYERPGSIEVVARAGLSYVGKIDTANLSGVRLIGERDTLVVLGNRDSESATEVRIFRVASAGALPALAASHTLKGRLADARLVDGRLALILEGSYVSYEEGWPVREAALFTQIPCAGTPRPFVSDYDFSSSRVVTLNAREPAEAPKSELVPGAGEIQYMTRDAVYLVKQFWYWPGKGSSDNVTVVAKVSFSAATGEVKLAAVGGIRGRIKDRWALKEWADINGVSLATTFQDDEGMNNALVVLQQQGESLEIYGKVVGFGRNEDIRAVRYVDKMAYVVTFEKTDPLFTIDLADLKSPKLLGELVIPGFSTYLHPLGEGRLLGLGFDADDAGQFSWAQGIQLSLFDASNPKAPRRIAVKVMGERGSSSEATHDAHAFYYDPAERIAAFPLTEVDEGYRREFSGAIAFRVGADLSEVARITHSRWMPAACRTGSQWRFWASASRAIDVSRLLRVDGRLLGISSFGITAHDPSNPAVERGATAFPALPAEKICPSQQYDW